MKKRINILWKVTLSLLLVFTSIGVFKQVPSIFAAEQLEVKEEITYNEENTQATISFDLESISETYNIQDVIDPEGISLGTGIVSYLVDKNDTYKFDIVYLEDGKEYTYEKEVTIDGIIDIKDTTDTNVTSPISIVNDMFPRSSVNDGDVTMNIPDYDESNGWENGAIKKVSIVIDFKDDYSSGKKLSLNVPEGLKFTQISVAGSYSTTGVDTTILSSYTSDSPEAQAIISMQLPNKETALTGSSRIGATYGDLEIEFTNQTEKITVDFYVRVDAGRYYKAMEIPNPITAVAYKNGSEIGNVNQKIQAVGDAVSTNNGALGGYVQDYTTSTIVSSTVGETSYGIGRKVYQTLSKSGTNITHGTSYSYVKSAKMYVYYPEGTEFDSFYSLSTNYSSYENDSANSRVIVYGNWISNDSVVVKYKIPENAVVGTVYTNPSHDYVEVEYYDGTTNTIVNTSALYSVTIVENSVEDLSLTLASRPDSGLDNTSEEFHGYASFFSIQNKNTETLKEQVVEFNIDSNWLVSRVNIPYDSANGNTITKVEYKTNKNDNWQEFDVSNLMDLNTTIKTLLKSKTDMEADEYFTDVRAEIGSVSVGYVRPLYPGSGSISTYGRLAPSATSATVTMSTYQNGKESETKETSSATITNSKNSVKGFRSGSSISYLNSDGTTVKSVISGDTFTVKASINTFWYYYSTAVNAAQMRNPEIYIRQPEGTIVNKDSIVIKMNNGTVFSDWELLEHSNEQGETIYTIKTKNLDIGYYLGEESRTQYITVQYDITTSVTYVDSYTGKELLAWGREGYQPVSGDGVAPVTDIYDFNGDGETTDLLFSFSTNTFEVMKNENVLIETYLTLEGEEPKDPYVESNSNTVAYFTPGTKADYIAKITNNGTVPADAVDIYVPIPKTGENFGINMQPSEFKWSMKLTDEIEPVPGFKFYYATEATEGNFKNNDIYSETVEDYSKVNMVKIVTDNKIEVDAKIELKVPLVVDEDFTSATEGEKIGERNIFNPVYIVDSDRYKGTLLGTKAGTELVIAEIGGIAFLDKDGDGLYNNEDSLFENIEVELYELNSDDEYIAVLDKQNKPIITTTDENGEYLFDYAANMGYGTYAVKFVNPDDSKYQYTVHNRSNTAIDSDALINGEQKGWVVGIDPTKPAASAIGCGFIEYAASDLSVNIKSTPNQVKVGNPIIVGTDIEPDFWENIKDTTTPYKWEIVGDTTEKAKATLVNGQDGTVTITPSALAGGTTTFQIKVTIKDVYGNEEPSDPITITIISNTPPTLSATPMEKYVGDTVNWLDGFSAKNNENEDIEIKLSGDDANTTINSSSVSTELGVLTTPGTYSVSYTVSDSYNNKATITRLVKVHGVPVISANTQSYVVSDSDIAGSVQSSGSALYMQAGDNVGDTLEEESIPVTYTITEGPSTSDFSKVGLYKVTYSATVGTVTRTKTVDVLVKSEDMVIENDLAIDVNNIALTQTEAKAFDLDKAIAKADVKAFEYTREDGDITGVDSLTDITISSIDDIKNVSEKGGEYKVTFTATGTSGTITKEILVVVEGTEIQEDNGIVVKAKGITLANTDTLDATSAKLSGEVSAYLLKDETVVIEIEVRETELTAINNVGLAGATKDLTFTAKDDGKSAAITVDVVVSPTLVGPAITISDCEHYVGDTFNVLHGVSAEDATNATITLDTSEENKNTNVTHSIPNDEDKFTTAGTYEVTIEVTDQFGNSSIATKLVKVNGLPEITAVAQEYNVSSSTIDADIIAAASASYLKAGDLVGNATPTTITGVTYTVKSGPSADFTEVGPYVVEYSVENDGKTATKEVSVLITDDTSLTENDLSIRADNIVLSQDEAKAFTEDKAITVADVKAYEYTKTDNVITGIDTLSEITSSDVASIKNVTEEGGEYKVTFTATGTSGTITKEILVVVEGTEIQENNGIVVKAKGFTIANTETINESLSQTKGRVSAYLLKNENEVDDIVTKAEELAAIKAVGLAGDTKPLTFTAEANGKTSAITINVVVSPTLQQPTITANNCEYYVGDPINIFDGVSAEDALGANIPLVLDDSVTYTTTIKGTLIYTTPGTYTTEYTVTDSYGNTQTASRTTKINGLPTIEVYNQVYGIDDTSIESQVEDAASASYLRAVDTVGNAAESADITANIEVRLISGPSNDYSEAGLYKVEYKVVQGGKTEIKEVDVLVISQGTQENDDLSINAENIALTQAEAKAVTKEDIVNKANAVAYDYTQENGNITKTEEVTSKITVSNLEDIKKVGETGNEFTVTLEVKQGNRSVSMNILVVVEGTEIQEDNGIVVKAKSFEIANADAVNADTSSVIDGATASAYELKTLNAVSTITTDASQLDDIKNSDLSGGTYPLTITATKDSDSVSIEVEVTVKPTVIKPDVTISDVEYYVGDEFLSLDGVSATDAHGEEITLSELRTRSISNTVIRHNMPLENGKLTTPGTYQLTYEISDRYGNVQTSTRIVKVHGLPEINADSQLYMVSDKQILEQVKNAISASYLQAQDTVGAQPLSVDLTGDVKVEVVSGPNGTLDFSAIGVYQIAYTVTNIDGKETTTTIDVMVQGDESTWDSTKSLLITGSGFNLTQKEAKDLTIAEAIVKGDVKAFEVVRDGNGNIIAYNDISGQITAYSDNIKSINKVTAAGGIFDLVFEAKQGDKSVSKLVKVTVEGTSTPPVIVTPDGYELGITASDFTIEYQKSLLIDANQAMVLAQVEAYLLNENKEIITTEQTINIKVNGKELEAIRNGGKNGGTYKLTFSAEYTASNGEVVTNTSTIDVTVLKEHLTNPSVAPGNTTVGTSDSTNIMFYLGLGLASILLLTNRKRLLKR